MRRAAPLETNTIDPQYNVREYDYSLHLSFFNRLKTIIRKHHVKGIIVGYPLTDVGDESAHCRFIDNLLLHMMHNEHFRQPITLVNENRSTVQAGVEIAQMVSDTSYYEAVKDVQHRFNFQDTILQKRVYDKIAAKIILERFLKYLNTEEEGLLKA